MEVCSGNEKTKCVDPEQIDSTKGEHSNSNSNPSEMTTLQSSENSNVPTSSRNNHTSNDGPTENKNEIEDPDLEYDSEMEEEGVPSSESDENEVKEFIKPEDMPWLKILRKLEETLRARKKNYQPIVATPQNLLKQKQNKSIAKMALSHCKARYDILCKSLLQIKKSKDELIERKREIERYSDSDSDEIEDLEEQIEEIEAEGEKVLREWNFFFRKKQKLQEIITSKGFDIRFVAGELTRQQHKKHGY